MFDGFSTPTSTKNQSQIGLQIITTAQKQKIKKVYFVLAGPLIRALGHVMLCTKFNKKRHRKYDASWLGIWTPLGTVFGGFWLQVGRQVEAKLAPKSEK